jgi:hypothetical protein
MLDGITQCVERERTAVVEAAANEVVGAESGRPAVVDWAVLFVEAAVTEAVGVESKGMTLEDAAAMFGVEVVVSMMVVSLVK